MEDTFSPRYIENDLKSVKKTGAGKRRWVDDFQKRPVRSLSFTSGRTGLFHG